LSLRLDSSLRLPSIDALRAFEASARLGSFERAADELSVSASAVSKRLAGLEELLGTALLNRTGRALTPTAAGKEYLQTVGAALELLARVPMHRRAAQRQRRLRVSAPPTFARQVLVPALESYTQAHPEVELEVVLSIPFLDVSASEADIEVRHGEVPAEGATVLMRDELLPMAAPRCLERLPAMRTPADLRDAPLLRTPIDPWAPWFRAAGLDWPEPAAGPKLVDLGLTLEAAVSGQGVVLARPSLARGWVESGALRPLFPREHRVLAYPAWLYYLLPHASDDTSADFAQWLVRIGAQAVSAGRAAVSGVA